MEIWTNHNKRKLVAWFDLPKKVQGDFDYIKDDDHYTSRFVKFHRTWYDTFDTQRISIEPKNRLYDFAVNKENPFAKWDAILSESFFSGVVFKFVDDDLVICGSYYS